MQTHRRRRNPPTLPDWGGSDKNSPDTSSLEQVVEKREVGPDETTEGNVAATMSSAETSADLASSTAPAKAPSPSAQLTENPLAPPRGSSSLTIRMHLPGLRWFLAEAPQKSNPPK